MGNETNEVDEIEESIADYNGMNINETSTNMNTGLNGLGNIDFGKDGGAVGTPYGYLIKSDTDKRKIAVDVSKFRSSEDYAAYMKKWLRDTGVVHVINETNACSENCITFALENTANIVYTVYIMYRLTDVINVMKMLTNISVQGEENIIHNRVILGHVNFMNTLTKNARTYKIELMGLEQIYEINNIIDNAISNKPYISLSVNKLSSQLGRLLYNKYCASGNNGIGIDKNYKDVSTEDIQGQLKGIGDSLTESVRDGIEQIKSQASILLDELKNFKK